ncbi:GNAT family N-acetyltransferase [Hymenobacter taeanensis]|uniref:GNAT family N-acetyltransferase n=1 Tax=Hymenobacter taeanensis TaxID=2735321 RepID=A0A6M6BFN5_9BACT|nr:MULTISPECIES: GNAT family N-acetyltransferase [Hymenobacter]QJX46053.1 GNAT family N-acetyltransferase [Hymenobacter taeanensis]UOQ79907.1 GNAT family N-acetyltransferase [Hymenobacter sp. 5414T-23]
MYAASPPLRAPAHTPIRSARLTLRPYLPSDQAAFFQLIDENRPRLRPSFPSREASVQTLADAASVLAMFQQDWQAGRLYVFGIWHSESHTYLGDISLKPNWTAPVTAEIGYYLAAIAEGQGYAREALAAVVPFGFETLRAARLLIRCRADNPRSCAVAESVAFTPLPPRPCLLQPFADRSILYYIRKQASLT